MKRGYLENFIDSDMEKFVLSKEKGLGNRRVQSIPSAITYHPLRLVAGIIQYLYLLHMKVVVIKHFPTATEVSFRSYRKFSNCFARAKLYPLNRVVASFRCGKNISEYVLIFQGWTHLIVLLLA